MLVKNCLAPVEDWAEWLHGGSTLHDELQDIHIAIGQAKEDFICFAGPVAVAEEINKIMNMIDRAYRLDKKVAERGYGTAFQMLAAAKQLLEDEINVQQVVV